MGDSELGMDLDGGPGLLPVVAIVGRPNVGKSTLFNQLSGTRNALVADAPGLTRDRQYGTVRAAARPFVVVDTGGLAPQADSVARLVTSQVERAIGEADAVVFLVDASDGLTAEDQRIAQRLRVAGRPVIVAANKTDRAGAEAALGEFFALGMSDPVPIAAAHGRGLRSLLAEIDALLPAAAPTAAPTERDPRRVAVAIVGRPNTGKSTLVNRLLGEERVVAHDAPGTTRDSVFIPFERGASAYILIDTAGVRRRGRVSDAIEKFSVIKTLQAVEAAHVVVFLIDATTNVSEQDLRLLAHVVDAGRALVIALSKWDAADAEQRRAVERECDRRLGFVDYAETHAISARRGTGLGRLMHAVDRAWSSAKRDLATPALTRVLRDAVVQHPPPVVRGRRIRLRYAHQGGANPPRIVIHGNQTEQVPAGYARYLVRRFREAFALEGTPVRLEFRTGENPYGQRKNVLTPRQARKRQRLLRHVKRRR